MMKDHDAELRELMRASAPVPPVDDVDWTALHARIAARTRTPRLQPTWWRTLAAWSPRGIPAAAAAAVIGFIMLGTVLRPRAADPSFVVIEEELASDLTGALPLVIAGADDDLLDALLFDGED